MRASDDNPRVENRSVDNDESGDYVIEDPGEGVTKDADSDQDPSLRFPSGMFETRIVDREDTSSFEIPPLHDVNVSIEDSTGKNPSKAVPRSPPPLPLKKKIG